MATIVAVGGGGGGGKGEGGGGEGGGGGGRGRGGGGEGGGGGGKGEGGGKGGGGGEGEGLGGHDIVIYYIVYYIDHGRRRWVCNVDTESLLDLDAMTPLSASRHEGKWEEIVSPLEPREWENGLANHPDRAFADYICAGIRQGFRLGYNYRSNRSQRVSRNMRSVDEHREVVEEFFREESKAGKLLGPLPRSSFPLVHVSPVGVIPKSTPGKWRIIVDLSSPQGGSVNDGISRGMCSLSYLRVDDVAAKVVGMGTGALMAKFDLRSAYQNVPVHPDDRWLLGTEWEDQLFVDTVLPFGLRSAPMIFNAVAEALAFIEHWA